MLRKGDLIRWNLLSTKLNEAKVKLQQLENREGKYADLPERIYYQTGSDGETVEIYGLNYGDTDEIGASLGYESNKTWVLLHQVKQPLSGMHFSCVILTSSNTGRFGRYLLTPAMDC
jgi:starch-binding outer membrane protein, SusD/RagB family